MGVGAYHSRTESLASKYHARYARIAANSPDTSAEVALPGPVLFYMPTYNCVAKSSFVEIK